MKIKKAFISEYEQKCFIANYFNGDINSEIIDNLLYTDSGNKELIEYQQFLEKVNNGIKNLNLLKMVKVFFAKKALKEAFGEKDFAIDELEEKSIWIVQFSGALFLVPYKVEFIYNQNISKEEIKSAIEFDKEFILFCIQYTEKNKKKLNIKEKENLEKVLIILKDLI